MWMLFFVASFQSLAPGIELGDFTLAKKSAIADSRVVVARVDPKLVKLRLLSANVLGEGEKTAAEWAKAHDLSVVINASMFEPGGASTGYMRALGKENGAWSKDKAVLAFDTGAAHIFDRSCDPPPERATMVQNIRMLGCNGENVWAASKKKWSTACVGEDKRGRLLFIHVRSPLDVHDLIDELKALPLDLVRLMYVEGGPEASLFVRAGGKEMVRVGSYETGFNENDDNTVMWKLPNVLGVSR